jgi:class 3 adenylate cyclase
MALDFSLVLNAVLLVLPWNPLLDTLDATLRVIDGDSLIFAGLRAKIGIFMDTPLEVTPHGSTGRADYFGTFVNRCARMMVGAQGGQVIGPAEVMQTAVQAWTFLGGTDLEQEVQLQPLSGFLVLFQ